jgi:hypothetical protein
MLKLPCLCCEHRNPAGSSYCNACGMPMHLRPCPKCETINQRAASHCRKCGEAFTFDFALAAVDAGDPETAAARAASSVPKLPAPRSASSSRASALLVGVIAAAGLSAFYAYRDPAPLEGGTPPAKASIGAAAMSLQSTPPAAIHASEARLMPSAPAASPSPSGVVAEPPATLESPPDPRGRRAKSVSSQSRAMVAGQSRAQPKATAVRKAAKRSRGAVQTAAASVDQKSVAATSSRHACAEGAPLSSACDVRMIAKGN